MLSGKGVLQRVGANEFRGNTIRTRPWVVHRGLRSVTQGSRYTARLPPIENKAVPLKFVYNLPQLGIDRFDVLWLCSAPSPQELAKFGMRSEFKILLSLETAIRMLAVLWPKVRSLSTIAMKGPCKSPSLVSVSR